MAGCMTDDYTSRSARSWLTWDRALMEKFLRAALNSRTVSMTTLKCVAQDHGLQLAACRASKWRMLSMVELLSQV